MHGHLLLSALFVIVSTKHAQRKQTKVSVSAHQGCINSHPPLHDTQSWHHVAASWHRLQYPHPPCNKTMRKSFVEKEGTSLA